MKVEKEKNRKKLKIFKKIKSTKQFILALHWLLKIVMGRIVITFAN